jgi:hypothetical protein
MTYTELVAAARAYADRQDIEVDANIDIFILMAEARMNRVLKTREQSARTITPTVDNQEYYSLPPDYRGMRDIQLNSSSIESESTTTGFTYLNPYQFNSKQDSIYGGTLYYTIIANQIQIYPCQEAGKNIEIVYFQKVPPLGEDNSDNWMSSEHPDIYLAGIVAEIESFVKNYEVAKSWDSKMSRSIEELETSDVEERWSGSPLSMRRG